MPPLVDVEVIVVAAALGNESDEGGSGAVDIVGNDVGAEAGCGGGGPAGPPSGKERIGAGDRLLAGELTGIGGGGPAGGPRPRASACDQAPHDCLLALMEAYPSRSSKASSRRQQRLWPWPRRPWLQGEAS